MTRWLEAGRQPGGGQAPIGGWLCNQELRTLYSTAAPRLPEVTMAVMTLTTRVQV